MLYVLKLVITIMLCTKEFKHSFVMRQFLTSNWLFYFIIFFSPALDLANFTHFHLPAKFLTNTLKLLIAGKYQLRLLFVQVNKKSPLCTPSTETALKTR